MDLEQRQELKVSKSVLDALINIRDNGAENKKFGICLNVQIQIHSSIADTKDIYLFINDMSQGWPHHSGMENYPIPSTNKKILSASAYYDTRYNSPNRLWQGRQRYLRNDLIKYMIKRLYRILSSYEG